MFSDRLLECKVKFIRGTKPIRMVPKAHWLKAVMISGLAILYSEMAEAERLRLECSVKTECYPERIIRGFHCTPRNPPVSLLVEIDLEANTWVEFFTHEDGKQTSGSGNLRSVTQYEITLRERSFADGRTGRETISRTSGAYSDVQYNVWQGIPTEVRLSGPCNKTTKPLPSAKF